jgi:hypothetical protein
MDVRAEKLLINVCHVIGGAKVVTNYKEGKHHMLINRLCGVFCAGFVALQVSSALAEPGVTDDKIIIGQSAGLTGAAARRSRI